MVLQALFLYFAANINVKNNLSEELQNLLMRDKIADIANKETYRRGRTELDSKSSCPLTRARGFESHRLRHFKRKSYELRFAFFYFQILSF